MRIFGKLIYSCESKKSSPVFREYTREQSQEEQATLDGSDFKEEKKSPIGYWRVTGHEPAIMLNRIVPDSWTGEIGCAEVIDNIANVEHIKWLLQRYSLEIVDRDIWEERLKRLSTIEQRRQGIEHLTRLSPSAQFIGVLRDFQKECLDFLLKTNGTALVADEMGLGKTVESLAYLVTEREALPALVIAPLITLENWRREILRFVRMQPDDNTLHTDQYVIPRINVIRKGHRASLAGADFYVINYELVHKRIEDLHQTGIRTIIADEIHNLRHDRTVKYSALKELSNNRTVRHRIGLSGTPVYNRGIELWSIMDFIYPGLLGTRTEFVKQWCSYYDERSVNYDKRQALYEYLKGNVMIRRRKVDVAKELPEKTRHRQRIDIDENYYRNEMDRLATRLRENLGEAKTSLQLIAQAYSAFNAGERQVAGISKVPHVLDFVQKLMELEEPIVVFCHHHAVHALLHQKTMEYHPSSIIGGQSDKERYDEIDRFQDGHTKLMIAGLRAGSSGINLTVASYVIFAELDWTPAIHRQAEDRLHRIGQTKPVFAYYLEGKGTIDEAIVGVLVEKTMEISALLGDVGREDSENDESRASLILDNINRRFGLAKVELPDKEKIRLEREKAEAELKAILADNPKVN